MNTPRIRVGIDVGGTFTDAVGRGRHDLELLGQVKVPTATITRTVSRRHRSSRSTGSWSRPAAPADVAFWRTARPGHSTPSGAMW